MALWPFGLRADQPASWTDIALFGIVLLGTALSLRWAVMLALSFAATRKLRTVAADLKTWPRVSILVPAFNEGSTIGPALESILGLDYPEFEVVVVDDGSRDDTLARAQVFEGKHGGCTIRVFHKPNGGKWSALNFGFRKSTAPLILCVDADSRLDPVVLRRLVPHMTEPEVCSVAGQVRVRNRENLVTSLQALEYVMMNGAMRLAQALHQTVLVVPGPIGLFRREALELVWQRFGSDLEKPKAGEVAGPFEGDTFAEDFDLSLAILALGGRIGYEPEAISNTKAPNRTFTLLNQRYRWTRGSIQVLRKFWRRHQADPRLLANRAGLWLLLAYGLDFIIVPALSLSGLVLLGLFGFGGVNPMPLLLWFATFMIMQVHAGALFALVHREPFRMLKALPVYGLYTDCLLSAAWLIAVVDEVRGTSMRW